MIKNSIIGFLLVCIVVIFSFNYKDSHRPVLGKFPIENQAKDNVPGEPPLYLYFFFSKNHCPVCLEAIEVLNELPSQFVVTGIVPGGELNKESELRSATGAMFNLVPFKDIHRRFTPRYAPTLFGVSGNGDILFILPGVPGEKKYLNEFLIDFYSRSLEVLAPNNR
jgi:thiol-disulfide isomerase/thioredoxin